MSLISGRISRLRLFCQPCAIESPPCFFHAGRGPELPATVAIEWFETSSSIIKVTLTARGSKWAYARYNDKRFSSRLSRFQLRPQTSTVQVTNRTIGSAMSRLKNTMPSTFYLQVLERTLSFQPLEQNDEDHTANSPEINPDETRASRLTFVEDFLLEHSAPGPASLQSRIQAVFEPATYSSHGSYSRSPKGAACGLPNLQGS